MVPGSSSKARKRKGAKIMKKMTRRTWLAAAGMTSVAVGLGSGAIADDAAQSNPRHFKEVPPRELIQKWHLPNVELITQDGKKVHFYDDLVKDKVVAINFIYTSCALPNFCLRIANNFGVLQKRFKARLGRDLVLLTVTFDPVHDTPEVLAHYASRWNADPAAWRFLTGSAPDVQRVCHLFGVDVFPDEGLINHSLHTAIINRVGEMVANIEGNRFTAGQLGDLTEAVLNSRN